jgi:hypothetical protein
MGRCARCRAASADNNDSDRECRQCMRPDEPRRNSHTDRQRHTDETSVCRAQSEYFIPLYVLCMRSAMAVAVDDLPSVALLCSVASCVLYPMPCHQCSLCVFCIYICVLCSALSCPMLCHVLYLMPMPVSSSSLCVLRASYRDSG